MCYFSSIELEVIQMLVTPSPTLEMNQPHHGYLVDKCVYSCSKTGGGQDPYETVSPTLAT